MATSPIQDWFAVKLTMMSLVDSSTASYLLTNRVPLDEATSYYPILEEINGVGTKLSDYLPFSVTGTVVINDERGSFGYERRFSDLLERYTIVNQSIDIYTAQTEFTDQAITADLVTVYSAKVLDWKRDKSSAKLSLRVAISPVEPRAVTRAIDSKSFPNAPASSVGRYLPIAFGATCEVSPVRIDADGDTSPAWAYATTFGTTFPVGGVQSYYAKDHNGKYQKVLSSALAGTAVLGYGSPVPNRSAYTFSTFEMLLGITTPTNGGYVIFGADFDVYSSSAGTVTSEFTVSLIEATNNYGSDRKTLGEVKKTVTTTGVGYAAYQYVGFARPIVTKPNATYYFGIQRYSGTHDWAGSTLAPSIYGTFRSVSTADSTTWLPGPLPFLAPSFRLYAAKFDDTPSTGPNADGLGYAYFEVSRTALSGDTCDLSTLDLIAVISGLKDDVSGTITGTPSAQITQPRHCIRLLDQRYSGGAWVGGNFSPSLFSSTHHQSVSISGATSGRAFADQVMSEICRNSAGRLAFVNGQLGFWQFGVNNASVATFTQENCVVLSVEKRGIETITNRIQMYFDRRFRDVDPLRGSADGQFKNYANSTYWHAALNDTTAAIAGNSETLYGARPLSTTTFDFLADTNSAEWVARYLLITGAKEDTYVQLEVDWFENQSRNLLDVVTILSPELPSFYGTSSNARQPTFAGTETDLLGGNYLARAKPYRAQIEDIGLIFRKGAAARMRLDCRLLTDFPMDPT